MKSFKGFVAIVALCVMNSAMGVLPQGVSPQSNYGRFLMSFNRPVITQNNMVDMAWVKGAVMALADDRITGNNVDNLAVSTMLWRAIENDINYYANLPQNRNNPDFRNRIWQSLTRSVDEVRYIQQPRVQPQMTQSVDLVKAGIQALRNFRMQTAQEIQTNPAYFYSAGSVQVAWLREALRAMLSSGQMALTSANFANVQDEITRAAVELIGQILSRDPRKLSVAQKEAIVSMVRLQVQQFMNTQQPQFRSRM